MHWIPLAPPLLGESVSETSRTQEPAGIGIRRTPPRRYTPPAKRARILLRAKRHERKSIPHDGLHCDFEGFMGSSSLGVESVGNEEHSEAVVVEPVEFFVGRGAGIGPGRPEQGGRQGTGPSLPSRLGVPRWRRS